MKGEKDCNLCQILVDITDPSHRRSAHVIDDMKNSIALLSSDQFQKGYTIVVFKKHISELYHLSTEERTQYCEEMIRIAEAIYKAFNPDKMNYELLGNKDAHMHWHLIPRYKNDEFWGLPVWVKPHEKKRLTKIEYKELVDAIKKNL
jgi:diadenosine tetraphosphate (Ap4A) HIT family hydrolase